MDNQNKLTKEQAIEYLSSARILIDSSASWEQAKARLAEAGGMVGYKPAFRCLILGLSPDKSFRWKE